MCGIVGYTGPEQAAPILLDGLGKLEYRGYDSAGLAVRDGDHLAEVVKATGKLRNLAEKTDNGRSLPGSCGIGHTRWATHGEPSQTNAHPHVSGNATGSASGTVESDVVGVHNGIIENYEELKAKLLGHGYPSLKIHSIALLYIFAPPPWFTGGYLFVSVPVGHRCSLPQSQS